MKYNGYRYRCGILKPPSLLVNEPRTCISIDSVFVVLPLSIINYSITLLLIQTFRLFNYTYIQECVIEENYIGNATVVLILYKPRYSRRYSH